MKYHSTEQRTILDLTRDFLEGRSIQSKEDVDDLVNALHYHEWCYYVQDDPVISDGEYDDLFHRLLAAEEEHPGWVRLDSPTQRVGSDLTSDFPTVAHKTPMLSLSNSYDDGDLREFDTRLKKVTGAKGKIEYIVEPKFDGGTIVLLYENDRLIRSATRGNGTEGEDITANVRTIKSIPLTADFSRYGLELVELRGEAIIRRDRFDAMNEERHKAGKMLFANPRNTATGGLRTKDPRDTAMRQLDAFIFQIARMEGDGSKQITTHHQCMEILDSLGFKIPRNESKICPGIEEVMAYCHEWEGKRNDYAYEIDGMVVKANDFALQKEAGATAHHPRWAMAFKFKAKQATTVLERIEYQMGKTGTVTPVAKVRPTPLAGVTVSSISLHNADFIEEKDLRIGDHILIERAGDVIPYVVKSFPDLRTGEEEAIVYPEFCPINTDENNPVRLVRVEGEAAWRCPHCVCGVQDLQRIVFFVSKDAMDVDGIGKSIVEKFYELGWLRDISDLYSLNYSNILALEGFKEKSVENLKNAIEESKHNPIHRVLYALGIHHFGKKATKIIAAEINHVLDLVHWSKEQYEALHDIGPILAKNVTDWFSNEENIALLKRLEARGVNLIQTEADRPRNIGAGPLSGQTILFTGKLQTMTRKEAKEKATAMGAKNISAVSGNLDILVAGEKAGSKLKKAKALGTVRIMSEDDFLNLNE